MDVCTFALRIRVRASVGVRQIQKPTLQVNAHLSTWISIVGLKLKENIDHREVGEPISRRKIDEREGCLNCATANYTSGVNNP